VENGSKIWEKVVGTPLKTCENVGNIYYPRNKKFCFDKENRYDA
jgi:hypothetical protein